MRNIKVMCREVCFLYTIYRFFPPAQGTYLLYAHTTFRL